MSRPHAVRAASVLVFVALVAGVAGCVPSDAPPARKVGDKAGHARIAPTAPASVPSPSVTFPAPLVFEHGFVMRLDDEDVKP